MSTFTTSIQHLSQNKFTGKTNEAIYIRKEEINLSLLSDDMIAYVKI